MSINKFIQQAKRILFVALFLIQAGCSSFKGTELAYEKIPTSILNKTKE